MRISLMIFTAAALTPPAISWLFLKQGLLTNFIVFMASLAAAVLVFLPAFSGRSYHRPKPSSPEGQEER